MKSWEIKGLEIGNCNCLPGCPCQFSQLPTDGTCEAVATFHIEEGHYGDVDLSGLNAACLYKWPGAVHHGNGEMQIVIDDRATDEQRAALEAIMTGQDTQEMATMWFIFSAMSPKKHPTLIAKLDMAYDAETGEGHASASGIYDTAVKPIPNIVSGDPHRISIALPHGFEFAEAEMATGTSSTKGADISLEKNTNSHAHIARIHLTGAGLVHA